MTERYVCIHGHFYQPPRENPWLEAVELQDSAYPYHDWNERIAVECYAPNAFSRILDERGRIVEITSNYERISFNFGPTLLAWLEAADPETYDAVLEADRRSADHFGGHGSALTQPYNHMIMPLANARDRRTQLRWGLADFRYRFGRQPAGVWLPETAVDLDTLMAAADEGLRFTILAPHQAARTRRLGEAEWQDVAGGGIDPTRPYLQRLPDGREIVLFFYDGPISRAVAFEGALRDGGRFAGRLQRAFRDDRDGAQLVHIATDGETYGHHHRHGEMALAFALRAMVESDAVRLTNYGAYLEQHPPDYEVEIVESTSWSCAHGIERWRSDCGCAAGRGDGWTQGWRGPLRDALDWLRDELAPRWETTAGTLLADPWAARDDYIDVVLDRSDTSIDAFTERHAGRVLEGQELTRALELLELQRHAMLMYTSCGWFFDEVSGIETVQVLQYAARAVQLARRTLDLDLETPFLERLALAPSNLPEFGDARGVYEARVRPAMIDLVQVGAHHAISLLFRSGDDDADADAAFAYDVEDRERSVAEAGRARLATGRLRITSRVTREVAELIHATLHLGDQSLTAGVRPAMGAEDLAAVRDRLDAPFEQADFPAVLRGIDALFPDATFTLRSLFRDQQRDVLDRLLEATLDDAADVYRRLYEQHAPLMRYIADLGTPLPSALELAAGFVLNTGLIRAVSDPELDADRVAELIRDARSRGVSLDQEGLSYALEGTLEQLAASLLDDPGDTSRLDQLRAGVELAGTLPFRVNTWELQNAFWTLKDDAYPERLRSTEAGDEDAAAWVATFRALGDALRVRV